MGEKVEVDWAGTKLTWVDPDTGEVLSGYLFVAVLPFSGYAFPFGYSDMKQENWIQAHISLFEFLGAFLYLLFQTIFEPASQNIHDLHLS